MSSLKLLILVLVLPFACQAQLPGDLILLRSDSLSINADIALLAKGDLTWYSNAIQNEMASKLYFGGNITEEIKDNAYSRLEEQNISFGKAQGELHFYNLADTLFAKQKWGLKLNLAWRAGFFGDFSGDLFRLVFSGNNQFRGQTAALGNSGASFMNYQKFGIGLFHKQTFSGINISYVNGDELFQAELDRGDLFTAENGDSLSLDYSGSFWYSDTARNGILTGNGAGLALDLYWNTPFSDGKGFIHLSAEDLGFIVWSDKTIEYSGDSTYTFEGVNIDALADLEEITGAESLIDTLNLKKKTDQYQTWLPAQFRLGVIREFTQKWYYSVEIDARWINRLYPMFRAGAIYSPHKNLLGGVYLRYSVFGDVQIGMRTELRPWDNWLLRMSLEQIHALVVPNSRGGAMRASIFKAF